MKPRWKLPRTRVLLKYTNRYLKRRKISRLRRRDWLRSSKRLNSRDNISMQMRPWLRKTVIESWRRARSVKLGTHRTRNWSTSASWARSRSKMRPCVRSMRGLQSWRSWSTTRATRRDLRLRRGRTRSYTRGSWSTRQKCMRNKECSSPKPRSTRIRETPLKGRSMSKALLTPPKSRKRKLLRVLTETMTSTTKIWEWVTTIERGC